MFDDNAPPPPPQAIDPGGSPFSNRPSEDSLTHEKRRSETWAGYATFANKVLLGLLLIVLLISLIFYGIPALDKGYDSSEATASGMGKLAEYIEKAGPELLSAAQNVNTTSGNVSEGSEQFKRFMTVLTQKFPELFADIHKMTVSAREGIDRTTKGASGMMWQGEQTIAQLNNRLNGDFGLIVGLTQLTGDLRTNVNTATTAATRLINEGTTTVSELRAFLLNPEWAQARSQVIALLTHADQLTVQAVGVATDTHTITTKLAEKAPAFFALLEKVMKTSAGYQKPILILTLLSLLTKALQGVIF
ncbi:MAG: hypothetical protein WBV94_20605 [Blastocatellia bacterium]